MADSESRNAACFSFKLSFEFKNIFSFYLYMALSFIIACVKFNVLNLTWLEFALTKVIMKIA